MNSSVLISESTPSPMGSDQPVPITSELFRNTSSDHCRTHMPSVVDFVHAMTIELMAMILIAACVTVATIFIFWRQFTAIKKRTPKQYLAHTVILCGMYQVVSLSSLLSMFVPKAFVLCDMLSHFTFLFGAYQLIVLFIEYVGGESNFIKHCSEEDAFVLRTPPCCCCCVCCHPMFVTKGKFTFIRLLIVQFILIQGIVFVALNVIYIESADLYNRLFLYILPVFVTSILFGVWGLNLITRMLGPKFPDYSMRRKYVAVQLVLMANKLQALIGMVVVGNVDFECDYPLTTAVYKHEVIQFVIICQMCALSIWALKLYQRPNQYDVTDATHNTTPNGQSSLLDKCSVTCVDLNDQRPINGTSY